MELEKYRLSPQWRLTKEEIWALSFEMLSDSNKKQKPRTISLRVFIQYAAVAVLALGLVMVTFASLYTRHIQTERGEHLALLLPDESKVELNAESEISYKPYWWRVSRAVALGGEAFFQVQKGSDFVVRCNNGEVRVLGTSFNVLARLDDFKVTCFTGKVRVSSNHEAVVLLPNMEATVVGTTLAKVKLEKSDEIIGWRVNHFNFTNVPLIKVIEEIERQYNIQVRKPSKIDYYYTGNFLKTDDPNEVLEIIGKPYGLKLIIEN